MGFFPLKQRFNVALKCPNIDKKVHASVYFITFCSSVDYMRKSLSFNV